MRETLLKLDFSFDLVKDAICYLSPNFTRAFSKFNISMNWLCTNQDFLIMVTVNLRQKNYLLPK